MSKEDRRIVVERVFIEEGNTIRYKVKYGTKAAGYFNGNDFYVKYDKDISQVPAGILVIPLLANLCPVAWIAGVDVYVKELDKSFYESLRQMQISFRRLYPRIRFSGNVVVDRLTEQSFESEPKRTAAFFSGGVDSLGTFLRRKAERPYFVTVWGADVKLNQPEMWQEVKAYNQIFGEANGSQCLFVESNMRSFLNDERIAFTCGRFIDGWWPGLQHGVGLVGLMAPLAYSLGVGTLYVPSALPPKLARSFPDGSNTLINNFIRWSGTKVELEGEELTRQDKVSLIAEYMRTTRQSLTVRVCWISKVYGNCGKCEKCLRTSFAMLAEGIDPKEAGFPFGEESYAIARLKIPQWMPNNKLKTEYWNEIRMRAMDNISNIPPKAASFFRWLHDQDLYSYSFKKNFKAQLLNLIPHPLFLYLKKLK